jgi:hypothetical protein
MPTQYNHVETKEKIIQILSSKGPCLPVQIAKLANLSPLFASAFLSELYEEGKIRLSEMRVGSSPLYILPGHEPQLENFIQYLNQKEKEAYFLLKKEKILMDESQVPAIRVALRAIRDFALPLKMDIGNETKLFWKFFLVTEEEVKEKFYPNSKKEEEKPLPIESEKIQQKVEPQPATPVQQLVQPEEKEEQPKPQPQIISEKENSSNIIELSKKYLSNKRLEIEEIVLEKKKEFVAKVRTESIFGRQEYLIVSKDKKKISDKDLQALFEKVSSEKMPVILLSQGDLDKKATEYLKSYKNLIKFEKIL